MGLNKTALLALCVSAVNLLQAAPPNRVNGAIDPNRVVRLRQPVKAAVFQGRDQGALPFDLQVEGVTLAIPPSTDQQKQLENLLEEQRNPSSPDFHKWLTPEMFAERFGASVSDVNAIVTWLRTEGLKVADVARGRNFIVIGGTAAELGRVFRTSLHYVEVDNETHYANVSAPSIPAALAGIVAEVRGLDNFRLKPATLKSTILTPLYTSGSGAHYLAPDDWSVIYNVGPLYGAGLNGTGQKVAVVGQTDINLSDIQTFRNLFGLPANPPNVILTGPDPGFSSGDLLEAELDLEWAGATARNATIYYVNSTNVFTSAQYVVNTNLAPVISMSYGGCEKFNSASIRSLAQQANVQGITWLASSGDSGAAACDASSASTATGGLAVNIPASFPEVTAIGGTTFSDTGGSYWTNSNSSTFGSATGYIPEVSWNDTPNRGQLSSTGGGRSMYYGKPSWQAGPGVPADGSRDVPDISFSASADHDGYLVYYNGNLVVVGGTSAPTPAFAGIVGILNQSQIRSGVISTPGLGNINPNFYSLFQISPGVFHDITAGSNIVPCTIGTADCTTGSLGYSAGPGYDLATGLGSVDITALFSNWNGSVSLLGSTTTLTANPASISQSGTTQLSAFVAATGGAAVPTGSVTFTLGSTTLGVATLSPSGSGASATLTVSGSRLAIGSNPVVATFPGNSMIRGSSGSATVVVSSSVPNATATFVTADTATQGNWRNSYGSEGYNIIGDQAVNPSYAAPVASGNQFYTWAGSSSDVRALQKASGGDRIASVWYSSSSFLVDSNITDQSPHQIALYCLDWDSTSRRQSVDVLDSNGNLLNTQVLNGNFNGGVYLVWKVTGHVVFRFNYIAGYNAVLSGIFFGYSAPSAGATFVRADTGTQGNWRSAYGAEGYNVIGDQASNPSYASLVPSNNLFYTWASSTSDGRALQKASNSGDRLASTWYSGSSFTIDTNITDQTTHQIALYCIDWDSTSRRQTIDVLDANNNVLQTQALTSDFSGGVYLVWNVTGHVKFRFNWVAGYNAVVSGVFFGGPAAGARATFLGTDTNTSGNWSSAYGNEGYVVIGDQSANPPYASPGPFGNQFYTWATSTGDGRGLLKASNPSDRIASTWYSGSSFILDTNISDQAPHQVAVYCVDWDSNSRRQSIDVLDGNNNVLQTQVLSSDFSRGVYLVWNVTGHIKFRFNWIAGYNAVVSGLFFGK